MGFRNNKNEVTYEYFRILIFKNQHGYSKIQEYYGLLLVITERVFFSSNFEKARLNHFQMAVLFNAYNSSSHLTESTLCCH
jgi:hypothetical protein